LAIQFVILLNQSWAHQKKLNKKIYFLRSNSTKFGGAENYLYRLSNALNHRNFDHKIIHSCLPKFLPSWLKALLFNYYVFLTKRNKFYFSLDRVTCPDIYRAGDGVHKVFLSIEKKSKLNLLHFVYLYLERNCFINSKYIIANSQMVKNQIIDSYNIDADKVKVIYNGIELKSQNYSLSFKKLSNEFKILKDEFIILFVGTGFQRKGVSEFLRIVSKLKTEKFQAFVVGQEKKVDYYIKIAKTLKIDHKITFTGPRLDVDDFYSISDIFLFPTHYDPFSNVVLEAMSFGNVIFTTASNGASEILDKKFIMKNSLDFDVASSIDNLFKDKDKLAEIKKDNKKKVQTFSINNNLDQTLELINTIE
jgi:UDP-glucose:(heptosyl)LPS alpha-1,3-glucosyltransferase